VFFFILFIYFSITAACVMLRGTEEENVFCSGVH